MDIYARQVNPQFQQPDLFSDEFWNGIYISGNDRYFGRTDDMYKSAGEVLDNLCDVASDIEQGYSAYNNIAEYLDDYAPRTDNRNYTADELKEWKYCAETYTNTRLRTNDRLSVFCKALGLISGMEYDWCEIHGCCQGDWNRVYYPTEKFSRDDISILECEYFNLGTEWVIDDSGEKPESPDQIDGYYFYCHDTDMDKIRQEIAAADDCSPGEVHLYSYHERVTEYYEPEQEESEDTEDYSPEM